METKKKRTNSNNQRERLFSIQVDRTTSKTKQQKEQIRILRRNIANRQSLINYRFDQQKQEQQQSSYFQEKKSESAEHNPTIKTEQKKLHRNLYNVNFKKNQEKSQEGNRLQQKPIFQKKYFVKSAKKYTVPTNKTVSRMERKSLCRDSNYSNPTHKNQGSNSQRNKMSLLSQRSHRLHTIDQIGIKQEQQQEAIKGCISSLQNILTDITNNKMTSRKLINYNIKGKQSGDNKSIRNLQNGKIIFQPYNIQEKKNKKKYIQSVKTEVYTQRDSQTSPFCKHKFDRKKHYNFDEEQASDYLIEQDQCINQIKTEVLDPKKRSEHKRKKTKHITTITESSHKIKLPEKQNNVNKGKQQHIKMNSNKTFKSYVEFIQNKKRQNNIQMVKKIRNNETNTKKIHETLDLMKSKHQNIITNQTQKQFIEPQKYNQENIPETTQKLQQNLSNQEEILNFNEKLQISSIDKISDSSFLSEYAKNSLNHQIQLKKSSGYDINNSNRLTQQLIYKKIGSQKSPINIRRERKLTCLSGMKQAFPQGFFQ